LTPLPELYGAIFRVRHLMKKFSTLLFCLGLAGFVVIAAHEVACLSKSTHVASRFENLKSLPLPCLAKAKRARELWPIAISFALIFAGIKLRENTDKFPSREEKL
jgi:hypothetical protein